MKELRAISLKLLILLESNELKLNRITSYTKLISFSSSLLRKFFGDGKGHECWYLLISLIVSLHMSCLTLNWLTACVLIHKDCLYDTLIHPSVVDFASSFATSWPPLIATLSKRGRVQPLVVRRDRNRS